MQIIGGFVFPHGTINLDPETRDLTTVPAYRPTTKENCLKLHAAMKSQAETLVSLKPDFILFITPHGLALEKCYVFLGNQKAYGSAEWDGDWKNFKAEIPIDVATTKNIMRSLHRDGVYADLLTMGKPSNSIPLTWGEVVPMWFINEAAKAASFTIPPCTVMGIPQRRIVEAGNMVNELGELGVSLCTALKHSLPLKRVAIVISGDLSHCHSRDPSSPYPFHEDAARFDNLIVNWAKSDIDVRKLNEENKSAHGIIFEAPDIVGNVLSCGFPGLVVLHSLLFECIHKGRTLKANFLEYSCPTYYGMLVAHFKE